MIENMAGNIGVGRDDMHEGSVKSLVQQLGIPVGNAGRWTKALYVAFGKEEQPTQRIIAYLTSKVQEKA